MQPHLQVPEHCHQMCIRDRNIDVLRISESGNDADDDLLLLPDEEINLDDEEEVDMENIDLSVPEMCIRDRH